MKKLIYTTNTNGSFKEELYFDNELKDTQNPCWKTTKEQLTQGVDADISIFLDGVPLGAGGVTPSPEALAQHADAVTPDTAGNFADPSTLPN